MPKEFHISVNKGKKDIQKEGTWRVYDIKAGLSSGVSCIQEDSQGALWIGTRSIGIFRFDGNEFKNIDLLEHLNNEIIENIYEDHSGRLWIATHHGVTCYSYATHELINYTNIHGLPHNTVYSITEDQDGFLWFGTRTGVARFKDGIFVTYNTAHGLVNERVLTVRVDQKNRIWFGTVNGLSCLADDRFVAYKTSDGLIDNLIRCLCLDSSGRLWIGTRKGISCFDEQGFTNYTVANNLVSDEIEAIKEDKLGHLWICTRGGVSCFDGRQFKNYTMEDGLPSNRIHDVIQDKEGRFWFADMYSGVTRYDPDSIQLITDKPNDVLIQDNQKRLWFGDGKELNCYDLENKLQWNCFFPTDVTALCADTGGHIWVGTDNGLFIFSSFNSFVKGLAEYYTQEDGLASDRIASIIETKDGKIYLGTTDPGFLHFWLYGRFKAIKTQHLAISHLLETRRGMICFGGWSGEGLSFYTNDQITTLSVTEGLEEGIIYSLLEDREGHLWIGTRRGLFCFNGKTFIKYSQEKGFLSLDHQSSAMDKNGTLWFGTKNGLYLYNKRFLQTITIDDGLPGNGISSLLPQEDGSLIIGTYRGIVRYNSPKSQPPYIEIEEVVADRVYKQPKKLKLDSSALITVSLSSINLNTNKIRYSYKLEGYMDEWLETWNNQIRFQNLPEGQYTLKALAINRDLVCSSEPATLEITIALGNIGQLKAEYEAEIGRMEAELKLHHQTNKQNRVLLKLANSKALINGDLDTALQEITTASAFTIEVDQVSVWLFEENRTKLRCADSYSCSQNKHKQGNKIDIISCPHYIEALEGFRVIVANDIKKDIRKKELVEKGIVSEQVISSLDAAIRVGGQTVGVVWYEHTSVPRKWKIEEEQFASTIADFVALAMEACERKKFQEEQQRLELQMQRAQKLESLGILAGGIAHDFNNLLTVMLGNADLILNELLTVRKEHRDITEIGSIWDKVREIKTASNHAANLSRQMLAYSGKGKFLSEMINLNKIVIEMNRLLRASIPQNIRMKFNLTDNLPPINADNSQISQVIMNLITNASEAIGDNRGMITVSTGTLECDNEYLEKNYPNTSLVSGPYIYLDISDTGCGMSEETQSKIFDPFFTTKFTGRGLGLAVVFGIVRGHNGAIKVLSKRNIGTTFRVLFPEAKPGIVKPKKDINMHQDWKSSGTILLVDDEEMVRSVGKNMLEMIGFDVLSAEDGIQGIQIFKENLDKIKAVILDLTMPRMSGEEAFHEMHAIRDTIPIILSSGYNEWNVVERFAGKGLASFVQKPYQLAILRQKIYDVLGETKK